MFTCKHDQVIINEVDQLRDLISDIIITSKLPSVPLYILLTTSNKSIWHIPLSYPNVDDNLSASKFSALQSHQYYGRIFPLLDFSHCSNFQNSPRNLKIRGFIPLFICRDINTHYMTSSLCLRLRYPSIREFNKLICTTWYIYCSNIS